MICFYIWSFTVCWQHFLVSVTSIALGCESSHGKFRQCFLVLILHPCLPCCFSPLELSGSCFSLNFFCWDLLAMVGARGDCFVVHVERNWSIDREEKRETRAFCDKILFDKTMSIGQRDFLHWLNWRRLCYPERGAWSEHQNIGTNKIQTKQNLKEKQRVTKSHGDIACKTQRCL